MNKLLVICGPTATGKTSLALQLAKRFNGELISSDSRQVYKYMNIGTGKDLPENAKWYMLNAKLGFYQINETKIWGYDLVRPDQDFSVSQFCKVGNLILLDILNRGKLPIIVGGTGLYIDGLVHGIETQSIPRDLELRKSLESKTAAELYTLLSKHDKKKADSLNESDNKNPRRLIRAIEIAKSNDFKKGGGLKNNDYDPLWIGLTLSDRQKLYDRIDERVDQRASDEFDAEITFLQRNNYLRVLSQTLGYREWLLYKNGNITKEEAIKKWKYSEHGYARRQITWFKKNNAINWFATNEVNWDLRVEKLIDSWHTKYYQRLNMKY